MPSFRQRRTSFVILSFAKNPDLSSAGYQTDSRSAWLAGARAVKKITDSVNHSAFRLRLTPKKSRPQRYFAS
jgi:hypothetical protein